MYFELVSDQHRRRFRRILLTWLATFCTCGYLLPWAVATTRGKANADAIGIMNLALGWTVVGWFVALGMASKGHGLAGLRITE
ncbi:superinfection immunity protein [Nocardioides sp. CPCC 206347]|uniref:superinfection immunity protein n=1 Tax=unclassified Nocardioides TaxID=2615069 RepID=UPI003621981E